MISKVSICYLVSDKDASYLFIKSIKSAIRYIKFIDEIKIIAQNRQKISTLLFESCIEFANLSVIDEIEFLSINERNLCGWSKQQILKLKADQYTQNDNILVIGADVIIFKELNYFELISNKHELFFFRKHNKRNNHFDYESNRVKKIREILNIQNKLISDIDFIFDIFIFKSNILKLLRTYLSEIYGVDYFVHIFPQTVYSIEDKKSIGEWTMYVLFVTEVITLPNKIVNGNYFLDQVHSINDFNEISTKKNIPKAIHFVSKSFNIEQLNCFIDENSNS